MSNSANNNIPFVPENTIDPASGLNEALNTVDALLQLSVVSIGANTPPASPAAGARYIVGTAPTGAWAGKANQLARWLDGYWSFFPSAVYAILDGILYAKNNAGTWAAAGGGQPVNANLTALSGLSGAANKGVHFTGAGAMATHDQTAQARTFMAAADAAEQRTAMGLGTAATATAVTSATDITAGRALTVGYAGVGRYLDLRGTTYSTGTPGQLYNTVGAGGYISGFGQGSQIGISADVYFALEILSSLPNGGDAPEVARSMTRRATSGGRIFTQSATNNATWGPWREFISTVNISAIPATGAIAPGTAGGLSLGTAALPMSTGYVQTAITVVSDGTTKTAPESIPDSVLDAVDDIDIVQYLRLASVEENGEAARTHAGVIAQQVKTAFEAHGLDPFKYSVLCWDEWEDGEGETKSIYSVRYIELFALKEAANKRRFERLEARINALLPAS